MMALLTKLDKYYFRSHQGPAIQCNFLAQKATGKILVRADGDMRHDRNYIINLVKPIFKHETVATFSKEVYLANPENIWAVCWQLNRGIKSNLIVPVDSSSKSWPFRAILKDTFLKAGGYSDIGYEDDQTVLQKLGYQATLASGAIAYCYNPASLKDVFLSSRWIGRGAWFKKNRLVGILKFNPVISLCIAVIRSLQYKKIEFLPFRLFYDLGLLIGIWDRIFTRRHIK